MGVSQFHQLFKHGGLDVIAPAMSGAGAPRLVPHGQCMDACWFCQNLIFEEVNVDPDRGAN
jgi:hypothetical protein